MHNRFYILDNGYLEIDKNYMVLGAVAGTIEKKNPATEWIKIPVYCVLIKTPENGWILFDTGCHPDGMKGRWSHMSTLIAPHFCTEEQLIVNQLKSVGLKPEDIKTVVLSHMHCDHAGGLYLFKDSADVYVNRDDFMASLLLVYSSQDPNASGSTCRADVIEPVQSYRFLGNKDYEIAPGVEILYTPGHTAGMMSLLVRLSNKTYIFPVDSLNMAENYGPPAKLAAFTVDNVACRESIEKIRELEHEHNARVIFSHDMEQFKTLKTAPECYE